MTDLIAECDAYLSGRSGKYEWRRVRYRAAIDAMVGLDNAETVVDVGAGWTEFDYTLRVEADFRGRYIPVDGGMDGTDLNRWYPPRYAEWFVALEIIEHLYNPRRLLMAMQSAARRGVIVSTPNPATTDVLGMDPTHITPCASQMLSGLDFSVDERSFYGQPADSLFATWIKT